MTAADVSDLMADHHVPRRLIPIARLDEMTEQHDDVGAKELRRECVQRAARLHEVGLRLLPQAGTDTDVSNADVEVRKLIGTEAHGAASDIGDHAEMRRE